MYQTFTDKDLEKINSLGISLSDVQDQMKRFEIGFPSLEITNFATTGRGIYSFTSQESQRYIEVWESYLSSHHSVVKFVPASGAASRMFKDLFSFLQNDSEYPNNGFLQMFFENIHRFAFFSDLDTTCVSVKGKSVDSLIAEGRYKDVIEVLLVEEGLNYGGLPKGLLKFHAYEDFVRTPIEEHLVEGALYAKSLNGKVRLHFTVSPEHRKLMEAFVCEIIASYEEELKVKFDIVFSEQKKSTDTIAVDESNCPFRDRGDLLFRPGGHGALIENLNDVLADVFYIKNIDNVVPDSLKVEEVYWKKILGGCLVGIQKRVFAYMEKIDTGVYSRGDLLDILYFLQNDLNVKNPDTKYLEDADLVLYLRSKLDRPIRVCGMVKNEGEAGGGPFFAVNQDGTISLQILESSQIDLNDPDKKSLFVKGTHFNPVDIVCGVKDFRGNKFDLKRFVDVNTGFVSEKTSGGKVLKALELPGLWNGAMSDWNTVFVEVPLSTFNPVKSVKDLLRLVHQSRDLA